MKSYLVRYSVEYSLVVEAESEDQAMEKADREPEENWDSSASRMKADEWGISAVEEQIK